MQATERKRLNLSVNEPTFIALHKIAQIYKFKNSCELVCTLISVFLSMVERNSKVGRRTQSMTEEIEEMFSDFAYSEENVNDTNGHVIRKSREWSNEQKELDAHMKRGKEEYEWE